MLCRWHRGRAAARVRVKHRHGTRSHARAHGIRARGENDRHARAEYHSRRVRLGEERQVFGQHVAGFEIGHDENLGAAGDRGCDAFDLRCFGIDGVVERQRAVEDAAVIWPRSAILQSAAASMVDGILGVTVSTEWRRR
jgi:hypothetical protein